MRTHSRDYSDTCRQAERYYDRLQEQQEEREREERVYHCVKCGHEATLDECYHNEYLKYPCCPECHFDADGEPTGNLERMEPNDE